MFWEIHDLKPSTVLTGSCSDVYTDTADRKKNSPDFKYIRPDFAALNSWEGLLKASDVPVYVGRGKSYL